MKFDTSLEKKAFLNSFFVFIQWKLLETLLCPLRVLCEDKRLVVTLGTGDHEDLINTKGEVKSVITEDRVRRWLEAINDTV